ncbi:MAG: TetR/AcrR family transcriptional regulator [Deltaproteobacteria bacterium]|nr:TetR/AcrR family transcriptional regulator [Deltaproteobacteria bacterium]
MSQRPVIDKAERRGDLLRAASTVFTTRGYHDAKVEDIAAQAGVAKGTFYLYFKDKRSVFVELVDSLFERISKAILRVDVAQDVPEQVKHNVRAIVAALLDEPETTQLLLSHAAGLDSEFHESLRAFDSGVRSLLTESLKDGQQAGIVAAGNPALYAVFAIGALKEVLVTSAASQQSVDREGIVRALYSFLEQGFLRPHATAPTVSAPTTKPSLKSKKR